MNKRLLCLVMSSKHSTFRMEHSAEDFEKIRRDRRKECREASRNMCGLWRWLWILVRSLPKPRGSSWLSQDTESIFQYNDKWMHDGLFGGYNVTVETITYIRREDGTWACDLEQTTKEFRRMVELKLDPDSPEYQDELEAAWNVDSDKE